MIEFFSIEYQVPSNISNNCAVRFNFIYMYYKIVKYDESHQIQTIYIKI